MVKILNLFRYFNNKTFKIKIYKFKDILRGKLQIVLFYFFPNQAFRLSPKEHRLPYGNEKLTKTSNVLDDIEIFDNDLFFDEVNIFFRGYGKNFINETKTKNKMLVHYYFLKDHNLKEVENYHSERELYTPSGDFYHVGEGPEIDECMKKNIPFIILVKYILKEGKPQILDLKMRKKVTLYEEYIKHNPKSKIIKFFFKTECKTMRTGSGIHAALIFSKISKKVNMKGWNFYLEKNPKNLSKFQALNQLYPLNYNIKNNFFEYAVCHLAYVKRIKELQHVKIEGYINDFVNYHNDIVSRCFKIFYK